MRKIVVIVLLRQKSALPEIHFPEFG